jgi:hypothetical protein
MTTAAAAPSELVAEGQRGWCWQVVHMACSLGEVAAGTCFSIASSARPGKETITYAGTCFGT